MEASKALPALFPFSRIPVAAPFGECHIRGRRTNTFGRALKLWKVLVKHFIDSGLRAATLSEELRVTKAAELEKGANSW